MGGRLQGGHDRERLEVVMMAERRQKMLCDVNLAEDEERWW